MNRLKRALTGFAVAAVLAVTGGVVAQATDVDNTEQDNAAWPSMCC